MPGVLYRCVFCDVSHEVTRRADGPVYLRCPTTYRWAWYDARAFDAARPARGAGRATGRAAGSRVTKTAAMAGVRGRRSASGGRRAAPTRAKAATSRRAGRKAAARPASRKRAGKRGRR